MGRWLTDWLAGAFEVGDNNQDLRQPGSTAMAEQTNTTALRQVEARARQKTTGGNEAARFKQSPACIDGSRNGKKEAEGDGIDGKGYLADPAPARDRASRPPRHGSDVRRGGQDSQGLGTAAEDVSIQVRCRCGGSIAGDGRWRGDGRWDGGEKGNRSSNIRQINLAWNGHLSLVAGRQADVRARVAMLTRSSYLGKADGGDCKYVLTPSRAD
ncbi:hypothetical protein V8C26DRAFT_408300 [Trichoderma gracile]